MTFLFGDNVNYTQKIQNLYTHKIHDPLTRLFRGDTTTVAALNFGGDTSGELKETPATEYISTPKSKEYHETLYQKMCTGMLEEAPFLKAGLAFASSNPETPPEVTKLIGSFLKNAKDKPLCSWFEDSHLKQDNKPGRPPHNHGASSDITTPVSEMYQTHCSPAVTKLYTGQKAGLWFFDLMGIWLREVEFDTFKGIIDESPLVGITHLMALKILLSALKDVDFILVQEMHRGDDVDDMLRIMGWSIIRHKESTAFLYKTVNPYKRKHPVPHVNTSEFIMTPQQYYEHSQFNFSLGEQVESIKGELASTDKSETTKIDALKSKLKLAEKYSKELTVIEKTTKRLLLVNVGTVTFCSYHGTQPKTKEGYELQQEYLKYLTDRGLIVGGDTNTSSDKIDSLMNKLGHRLLGDNPKEPTSIKMRSKSLTHAQFLNSDKAGVSVKDPKTHIMVAPMYIKNHVKTVIVSDGPVNTKKWPSDHMGKMSIFRGLPYIKSHWW